MKTITKLAMTALAAPLAMSAMPAAAQDGAEENLRCAAWALLASEQAQDPEQKRGIGMVMAYFMGRYEASSGKKIGDVMSYDALPTIIGDLPAANAACQPLAKSFGNRLTEVGMRMQAEAQAQAASQTQGNNAEGGR
ncbi:hypothetical protein [Croceicoccus hydrothermalis]|uniref:hypothetical protein n=1 Tax=Croceicoccus hydrothermalis TaxID=2867964 RepID=UPI001EFB0B2E|nr:hypothetical protein [Croceicoccus hydrothermalis]